jgi:hypothetical protein
MSSFVTQLMRIFPGVQAAEKVTCFHCEESVRKKNVIMSEFDGKLRPLCCHGCVAVLKMIEQNHLVAQYHQARQARQNEQ